MTVLREYYTQRNSKSGKSVINLEQYLAGLYITELHYKAGLTIRSIDYGMVKVDGVNFDYELSILNRRSAIQELGLIRNRCGLFIFNLLVMVCVNDERISGRTNYDCLRVGLDEVFDNFLSVLKK